MKHFIGSIVLLSLVAGALCATTAVPEDAASPTMNATVTEAGDTIVECHACSMMALEQGATCHLEPKNASAVVECNISQGQKCYVHKKIAGGQIAEFKRGCMDDCKAMSGCDNVASTGECRSCCDTDKCNVGQGSAVGVTCNLFLIGLAMTLALFQ